MSDTVAPSREELLAAAQAWRDHLARTLKLEYVGPTDHRRYILAAGSQLLRWFGMNTVDFQTFVRDVSVTLPTIPGLWDRPVILLAQHAVEEPLSAFETPTHEAKHGQDFRERYRDAGPLPAEVNYALLYGGEGEARAACEAEAYEAGLYTRRLLTGKRVGPEETPSRMHRLYLLGEEHIELAADIARSHQASTDDAGMPPLWLAREFRQWMDDTHPHLIGAVRT